MEQGFRAEAPGVARPGTMPDLLGQISQDVQNLVRAETELARAELREAVHGARSAAISLGVALGLALASGMVLLAGLVLLLALVMPAWAAALLVAAALLPAAAVAVARAARVSPRNVLERTRTNVKEDLKLGRRRS